MTMTCFSSSLHLGSPDLFLLTGLGPFRRKGCCWAAVANSTFCPENSGESSPQFIFYGGVGVQIDQHTSKMLLSFWLHSQAPTVSSKVSLSNQQICCEGNTKCGRNCLRIGEQCESRCLNVGMSELRVKTIILPHLAQHEREISKKKAGSCSPPGVMGNCNERGSPTPGHIQPVLAPQASWASAQDSKIHCSSPCQEGAGRKLITSGLLARAESETSNVILRYFPQQGRFQNQD